MPIALLLQQDFQRLARAATVLDRWREVLAIEALVIDRARGAFVVTWFGTAVPRRGDALSIGIVNIEALGEQFRRARARSLGGDTGANLAEPVAGLMGTAVGLLLSPSGSILAIYGLLRTATGTLPFILFHLLFSTGRVGGALLLGAAGVVAGVGAGVAAVLLPIGLIGSILYIAFSAGRPGTGQLAYELLGALARLGEALPRLVAQLLGPREGVRNPLVRSMFELVDRLAALLAQAIGAIALLVTRIGPLILPWTREFIAIGALARAAMALLAAIVNDMEHRLAGVFAPGDPASIAGILSRLLDSLMAGIDRLMAQIGRAFDQLASAIRTGARAAIDAAESNIRMVIASARALVMDVPLVRTFRALAAVVTIVSAIRSALPPSPPSASGPSMFGMLIAALPSGSGPSFPSWPGLPDAAQVEGMIGPRPLAPSMTNVEDLLDPSSLLAKTAGGLFLTLPADSLAPFRLTPETRRMIERLTRAPASIVADQLAALVAEQAAAPSPVIDVARARDLLRLLMGILPADTLAAITETETDLRADIHSRITATILPFVTRHVPALRPMLESIDAEITARVETDPEAYPVRTLPDNGLLRPVVGRLTVVLPGGDAATARNFAADLTRLLRDQPYLAAA